MQVKNLIPFVLAGSALAQSGDQQNLTQALGSQNSSLSSLIGLLGTQPALVGALAQAQNVTILAPSNQALEEFLKSPLGLQAASNPDLVQAVLQYHVLNGTYYASDFDDEAQFLPTLLQNQTYTNVTGGQRVEARTVDGNVTFFSALKHNSSVVTGNVNFTAGTIHVINRVLDVPLGFNRTLQAANLTAAVGAVRNAKVGPELAAAKDLTIFVPNNAAFSAIGSLAGSISETDLANILKYHVVAGQVVYSSDISNTSLQTLNGGNLTVSVVNGSVFVNNAQVLVPDVLVGNGVVHIIDSVLNPNNTSASPEPTASTRAPAFSGASSATDGSNPYTSGVEGPTSTPPLASNSPTGGVQGTSSSTEAAPMRTAAVGAAALFGGMAAYMNM